MYQNVEIFWPLLLELPHNQAVWLRTNCSLSMQVVAHSFYITGITKQILKWLIYSIIFGAIITIFGSMRSFQEWVGLWICGTVFFLGMLINMLGAKEK
ncbi:MAG: hypothetical protein K9G37_05805 [Crocinitomicaceae bacterium]|nr:hypothetical protein [Crocinitomicaceae bacterium]